MLHNADHIHCTHENHYGNVLESCRHPEGVVEVDISQLEDKTNG